MSITRESVIPDQTQRHRPSDIARNQDGGSCARRSAGTTLGRRPAGRSRSPHAISAAVAMPFREHLYAGTKRLIDLFVAAAALLLLSPLLALLALAILIEDRGPVFFNQTRVGRNGRRFRFYKFRSMVRNAEQLKIELQTHNEATGPIFKMRADPRITRVGRWMRRLSMDELPQLVNVLRGEMSLVGPRPQLPCEVARYTPAQRARLSVQPGLICLREISGRSNLSFERWIELDLEYVRSRSLATDLRILLGAIPAVLSGDGAF